ncbi:uncharacterized protein ColSpa_06563 [Colletotrichum spaethianum]|uniref:Alpha/beta hydrolase fold-3 domain-containing protein n=1 Tax=Colletotrichum spaethianum TaxID=700344 RepID=A0AA37LDA8_9PEZI|nr:uncharacterized protein ColSpa_06563 [Colletotrichum spaethianum]GKT46382.1 hypothetical protein ColSpa_06563 [Colletotrichum spaethianum]
MTPRPLLSLSKSLHNVTRHAPSTPLVLYIPPFSPTPGTQPAVPRFLRPYPTAVINYRWSAPVPTRQPSPGTAAGEDQQHDFSTPLQWPTPLHDTLAGYTWITENLRPLRIARRDVYVYSSHAGASIAASLALTESHHHERMAVRGLVAWNGIYNWSMFLPDHKVNKPASARSKKLPPRPEEGSALHMLQMKMPELFRAPVDLLDPFASPSLFFQTAGRGRVLLLGQVVLHDERGEAVRYTGPHQQRIPSAETKRARLPAEEIHAEAAVNTVPPRLPFGRASPQRRTMKTASSLAKELASRTARQRKVTGHTFKAQATELAGLMRRSLEKLEFKARMEWDEDFDEVAEAERRVGIVELGENEGLELGEQGQEAVREWLEDRIRL